MSVANAVVSQVKKSKRFESDLGKRAFKDLSPRNVHELSAANGIIRILGSKEGQRAYEEYKKRIQEDIQGEPDAWKKYLRQDIADNFNYEVCVEVLEESKGVLIYQEQLSYLVEKLSRGKKTFTDGNMFRKKLDKFGGTYGRLKEIQAGLLSQEALTLWHSKFMELINEYILPYMGKDGWQSEDPDVQKFLNYKKGYLIIPNTGLLSWIITSSSYLFNKYTKTKIK